MDDEQVSAERISWLKQAVHLSDTKCTRLLTPACIADCLIHRCSSITGAIAGTWQAARTSLMFSGAFSFRSTGRLIFRLDSPSRLVVLMKHTCSGTASHQIVMVHKTDCKFSYHGSQSKLINTPVQLCAITGKQHRPCGMWQL